MIGIYEIRCIKTDKVYVGQSVDIERRLEQHKTELLKGEHKNRKLSAEWQHYGEESFRFNVIQECEKRHLNTFEAYYIELFDSIRDGYNEATVSRLTKHSCRDEERLNAIVELTVNYNIKDIAHMLSMADVFCILRGNIAQYHSGFEHIDELKLSNRAINADEKISELLDMAAERIDGIVDDFLRVVKEKIHTITNSKILDGDDGDFFLDVDIKPGVWVTAYEERKLNVKLVNEKKENNSRNILIHINDEENKIT